MRKLNFTILLGLALMLIFGGAVTTVDAQKRKKSKETTPTFGLLSVKTSPETYPMFINGVDRGFTELNDGTTAVGKGIELPPGEYEVEIRFPKKTEFKKMNIVAGQSTCMCLKYTSRQISRPCPYNVTVDAPNAVRDGDNIVFTSSNASPGEVPSTLNYRWTVSPGNAVIKDGQGTPSITIDSTGFGGQRISAVLEVDTGNQFEDAKCRQRVPVETIVEPIPEIPRTPNEFDRFDFTNNDAMKARLDNFASALQNQPDVQGYMIVYARRGGKPADADRLGIRALDYLTRSRKVDSRRVVVVNGGFSQRQGFDLWLVPPGADPPMPRPR